MDNRQSPTDDSPPRSVKQLLAQIFVDFEVKNDLEKLEVLQAHPNLLQEIINDAEPGDFTRVVNYYPKDKLIELLTNQQTLITESSPEKFKILLSVLSMNDRWLVLEYIYRDELLSTLKQKRKSNDFGPTINDILLPRQYIDELTLFILQLQDQEAIETEKLNALVQSLLRYKVILAEEINAKIAKNVPLEKIHFSVSAQKARNTIRLLVALIDSKQSNQEKLAAIVDFSEKCKSQHSFYDRYAAKIVYTAAVFVVSLAIGALVGLIVSEAWIPAVVGAAVIFGALGAGLAVRGYDDHRGGREYMNRFSLFKSNTVIAEEKLLRAGEAFYQNDDNGAAGNDEIGAMMAADIDNNLLFGNNVRFNFRFGR